MPLTSLSGWLIRWLSDVTCALMNMSPRRLTGSAAEPHAVAIRRVAHLIYRPDRSACPHHFLKAPEVSFPVPCLTWIWGNEAWERGELLPTVTFRLIETITLCGTAKRDCRLLWRTQTPSSHNTTPPPSQKKKLRPNLSVNLKCQGETASEMQRLNVN